MSSEEIEERRRAAKERLHARRTNEIPVIYNKSFYGNSSKLITCSNLHEHEDKRKNKPLRLLSAPYEKNIVPMFQKAKTTCTCSVISHLRFTVISSQYNPNLIKLFSSIPSKCFDPKTSSWNFLILDYDLILQKMSLLDDIIVKKIPEYVLRICKQPNKIQDTTCLKSLGIKLQETLMPFQKEGVCFGIGKNGKCLISDEMGLGKTYQAIGIADFYRDDFPLLICTTAISRDVWKEKIHLLLPYIPLNHIVTMTSHKDYFCDAKVLIISYSLLEKNASKLLEKKFGILIMDESHSIKNQKAKCANTAISLAKKAKRVILLTGTPALSRPSELYTQLQMLDSSFLSYKEYTLRYCNAKHTTYGWDVSGQSNLQELNVILNKKYMIRRVKSDVMSELTAKFRERVILDKELILQNKQIEENMSSFSRSYSNCNASDRDGILLQFYSETAKIKTKAVCSYVNDLVKEKIKFIIFAHHIVMLDAITECLLKLKIDFIRIDGSTSHPNRVEYINRFQHKDSCRVAVLSLKACNSGITLTSTQMVIFAELDWNPSTLVQAESRAHRIGQEGDVTIRYLLAETTADDIIWQKLQDKQKTLKKAGLCDDDFSNAAHIQVPSINGNIEKSVDAVDTISHDLNIEKEMFEFAALLDDNDFQMGTVEPLKKENEIRNQKFPDGICNADFSHAGCSSIINGTSGPVAKVTHDFNVEKEVSECQALFNSDDDFHNLGTSNESKKKENQIFEHQALLEDDTDDEDLLNINY